MPNEETKLPQLDTSAEEIGKLQKVYDELYAKVMQLMDEFEERSLLVDSRVVGIAIYFGIIGNYFLATTGINQ